VVTQELINFIQSELQLGKTPESIIPSLATSGWQLQDIESAFSQLGINVNFSNTSSPFSKLFKLSAPVLIGIAVLVLGVSSVLGFWGYKSFFANENIEKHNNISKLKPSPSLAVTPTAIVMMDCGSANLDIDINFGNNTNPGGAKVRGQTNLQCMVQQAKICSNARLTLTSTLNLAGTTSSTLYMEIGKDPNGCALKLKQGPIDHIFPTEVPQENRQAVLDALKKVEKTNGICIYSNNNDLADAFDSYLKGNFSLSNKFEDSFYHKGKCSGAYFDLMYPDSH